MGKGTIGPQAGKGGWLVAVALAAALGACAGEGGGAAAGGGGNGGVGGSGGTSGTGGVGGSGGTGGSGGDAADLEALCLGTCQPLADCGFLPPEHVQTCVDLCLDDPAQEPERLEACGACMETATCDDVLMGCTDACSPPLLDVTVGYDNTGSDAPAGELVVTLVDGHTGVTLGRGTQVVGAGDDAVVLLQRLLPAGRSARLDVFLDTDGDGACTDADRTWQIELAGADAAVSFTLDRTAAAAPDACVSLVDWERDLRVRGADFDEAHEGKAVTAVLREQWNGKPMGAQVQGAVVDGGFALDFTDALWAQSSVRAAWFLDVDGDGRCDPEVDVGGSVALEAPFTAHATMAADGTSAGTPECGLFYDSGEDLALTGSGYDAYDGQALKVSLAEAESGEIVAVGVAAVVDGGFVVEFPRSLATGVAYRAALLVDLTGDGSCGAGDAMWLVDVPAADAALEVEVPFSETFDEGACAYHTGGF